MCYFWKTQNSEATATKSSAHLLYEEKFPHSSKKSRIYKRIFRAKSSGFSLFVQLLFRWFLPYELASKIGIKSSTHKSSSANNKWLPYRKHQLSSHATAKLYKEFQIPEIGSPDSACRIIDLSRRQVGLDWARLWKLG